MRAEAHKPLLARPRPTCETLVIYAQMKPMSNDNANAGRRFISLRDATRRTGLSYATLRRIDSPARRLVGYRPGGKILVEGQAVGSTYPGSPLASVCRRQTRAVCRPVEPNVAHAVRPIGEPSHKT